LTVVTGAAEGGRRRRSSPDNRAPTRRSVRVTAFRWSPAGDIRSGRSVRNVVRICRLW